MPDDLPFIHKATSYFKDVQSIWRPCGKVTMIKEADDKSGRIVCADCGGRVLRVGP